MAVVILLRWLVKLRIVMAVGEFFLFCAALFTSCIGAAGRVFEVVEMNGEEPILEEMLEDGDLLEGKNGDNGYAVLVENGENVAKVEREDDREWLR